MIGFLGSRYPLFIFITMQSETYGFLINHKKRTKIEYSNCSVYNVSSGLVNLNISNPTQWSLSKLYPFRRRYKRRKNVVESRLQYRETGRKLS